MVVRLDRGQEDRDADKALKCLLDEGGYTAGDEVIVLGAFGGRLDHVLGNLTLAGHITGPLLVGDGNLCLQLCAGHHLLRLPTESLVSRQCSLLWPRMERPARLVTRGLRWDLEEGGPDADYLEKIGAVASVGDLCQVLESSEVVVQSSDPVFWHSALLKSAAGPGAASRAAGQSHM